MTKVVDQTGKSVELDLFPDVADGKPQLTIKFDDHSLLLKMGSRNDLFAAEGQVAGEE